jgi:hypothetical protein
VAVYQIFSGKVVPMSKPWIILTWRYGKETPSPSAAELAQAMAELYHETLPGMTQGDYAEHGAASLRCGYDDGPMYILEANRLGDVTFEEWADQDYERELASSRRMRIVPEELALRLWICLAQGDIGHLRSQQWE